MKLVSFWGKGGVGKTTCSAALAVGLSETQGMKVLLLTTDLTPTLSDVLSSGPSGASRVEGYSNLFALELDERTVIEMWKRRFGGEVYDVVSSFLPVDESFIDYLAGVPGIAEQFILYALYEIVRKGDYDVVVWDTPASSSSLRLLRIEKELYDHMGDALRMYLRLKGFLDRIRSKEGDPLKLIGGWRELAREIFDMLASDYHSAYIVATPERISYEVSKRVREELLGFGIEVKGVILNKYLNSDCDCLPRIKKNQEEVLELFMRDLQPIKLVEYYDSEIRGKESLLSFYGSLSIQLP